MKTIILVIGVVKKGKSILLRKKPDGSPPYKETWYIFGSELNTETPEQAIRKIIKHQTGLIIKPTTRLGWDTEIKPDHTGTEAYFIYLNYLCEYVSGELVTGKGIEKLEWVKISNLSKYDLVPPSKKLFKKIGYL